MESGMKVNGIFWKKVAGLIRGDLRNIRRDLILLGACMAPVLIALVLRFLVPFIASLLLSWLSFDLVPHYPFIVSVAVLFAPMMFGTVIGFLIVDERDENILVYYAVTPLTRTGYLAYRLVLPTILGFLSVFLISFGAGLTHDNVFMVFPVALLAALEAPLFVLVLGAFATNKVEALTLSKALGLLDMVPVAGYLAPDHWGLFLGIFPPYWVSQAFLAGKSADWTAFALYFTAGIVVHGLYIAFLLRRFIHRIS